MGVLVIALVVGFVLFVKYESASKLYENDLYNAMSKATVLTCMIVFKYSSCIIDFAAFCCIYSLQFSCPFLLEY